MHVVQITDGQRIILIVSQSFLYLQEHELSLIYSYHLLQEPVQLNCEPDLELNLAYQ